MYTNVILKGHKPLFPLHAIFMQMQMQRKKKKSFYFINAL